MKVTVKVKLGAFISGREEWQKYIVQFLCKHAPKITHKTRNGQKAIAL